MNALPLAVFRARAHVVNALSAVKSRFALVTSWLAAPVAELELDEEIVHLHHCRGAWARDGVEPFLVKIAA